MRLRYNNALGVLGATLGATPGPDTITFAQVPPFRTITGTDYVPLILDPPSGPSPNGSFEIAYLVNYTAGQNTGTIRRGQEGTSTIAHVSGATWTCGPGARDFVSSVLVASPVLDVGQPNQVRAGRQLSAYDFTMLGLQPPAGLWNLSDLTDASGNGRTLGNKGAVPFGVGINGAASTAAQFAGNTGQGLYVLDTGAADPFRIKTGSWGCWLRVAKRGVTQSIVCKRAVAGTYGFELNVGNVYFSTWVSLDGSALTSAAGVSDICDDRWHWGVGTFDGTALRLYVDGVLEAVSYVSGAIFASPAPLSIGLDPQDNTMTAAGVGPNFGRVDEAFVTADVLTADQVRMLYCAELAHGFVVVPSAVNVAVRRGRKGMAFAQNDFAGVLRLHNFTGGLLGDDGTQGVALTSNPGTGSIVAVAGADGTGGNAYSFTGAHTGMSSSDTGLPSGTATRSYGCWFKTISTGSMCVMGWGTTSTADARLYVGAAGGVGFVAIYSGADSVAAGYAADGLWHFGVCVEDNNAADGVKRKLYVDGRVAVNSTVLNSITLVGAGGFRVGGNPGNGSAPFVGQIDRAFVCGYALTSDQVLALYAKGTQLLAPSVKDSGAHVEAVDATSVYVVFDTLDSQHQVDLAVVA